MITTTQQDEKFLAAVIPICILAKAIAWICENLSPEDVFFEADLEAWAEENGYTKEK